MGSTTNFQLPTSKECPTPNDQPPTAGQPDTATLGSWGLEVAWALEVGSWALSQLTRQFLVTASSRFSSTLAAIVHAAASAAACPAAGAGATRPASRGTLGEVRALGVDVGQEASQLPSASDRARRPGGRRTRPGAAGSATAATARRQRPCGVERRGIVQQRQRLQRRVGAHAPRRAKLAAGGVERHEASDTATCDGRTCRGCAGSDPRPRSSIQLSLAVRACPRCPSAATGRRSGRRSSALSSPLAASGDVADASRLPGGTAARARAGGCRGRVSSSSGVDAARPAGTSPTSTIGASSAFWLQPLLDATRWRASRAARDATAASPCVPKSSLVSTMPRPKSCSQSRFTATRASAGCRGRPASAPGRAGSPAASSLIGGSAAACRRRPARPAT